MKKIWEISGVNFFEKWLLISNPASKNIICKKICAVLDLNSSIHNGTREWLEKRLKEAYLNWSIHTVGFLLCLPITQDLTLVTLQLLVNVYPTLVQIKIGLRVKKILNNKKLSN
jgi:hypothetical protein